MPGIDKECDVMTVCASHSCNIGGSVCRVINRKRIPFSIARIGKRNIRLGAILQMRHKSISVVHVSMYKKCRVGILYDAVHSVHARVF